MEWDATVVELELSDELLEAFVLLDDSVFGSYTVKTMRVFFNIDARLKLLESDSQFDLVRLLTPSGRCDVVFRSIFASFTPGRSERD